MKPKRIQSKHAVPREAWLELNMSPEAIQENLKQRLIENLARELYNSIDIVKESNGWVGEEWRVDITVMSTDEYNNLMRQLYGGSPNPELGGGYHCPQCGKYNRTSVICDHDHDLNQFINKLKNEKI